VRTVPSSGTVLDQAGSSKPATISLGDDFDGKPGPANDQRPARAASLSTRDGWLRLRLRRWPGTGPWCFFFVDLRPPVGRLNGACCTPEAR
jgi:hypothetical protein